MTVRLSEQIAAILDVAGPNDTALQAAIKTLRLFERFETQARDFFTACIQAEQAKREAAEHPAVKMVLDAFPGAGISDIREVA